MPTFGARLWNGSAIGNVGEFSRRVARHVLGTLATDCLDVYDELGGPLPPVDTQTKAHFYDSLGARSVVDAITDYHALAERPARHRLAGAVRFSSAADAYVDSLGWLLDRAEKVRRGVVDA